MAPSRFRARRARALVAAIALALALPASALGSHTTPTAPYLTLQGSYLATGALYPLINVGQEHDGVLFEGIPDGIGVVPIGTVVPGVSGQVDLYVNHEQSRVPFDADGAGPQLPARDMIDSSVTRWRVDLGSKSIVEASLAISDAEGFIRFCSSFIAGPAHGFDHYTLLTNEESDDDIAVPAGAIYGSDPSIAPNREAGYTVAYDTVTGELQVLSRMGRHNHENAVVVPGGWRNLAVLSGDDTFNAPASQLYLYTAKDDDALMDDKGQLLAFQVTGTGAGPVADPFDPFNGANDYHEITPGQTWSGRFIHVPSDVARGVTGDPPQKALEDWSNANNVFQFIRVEDIAYDPDNPRVVYFTDTGERRALTDAQWAAQPSGTRDGTVDRSPTGRLHRALGEVRNPDGTIKYAADGNGDHRNGRVFRMVLNAEDPRIVDAFSIVLDADLTTATVGMRNPDNLDISHGTSNDSLMVQEDTSNAVIWRYTLDAASPAWSRVAQVTYPHDAIPANDAAGESSGIVSLGGGWWALDVQSHVNQAASTVDGIVVKREDGQLLLMNLPGT